MSDWFTTSPSAAGAVVLTSAGIYLTLIVLTRTSGLRSFSKMSGFDFAMTVAIGSIIATTILTRDPPLIQAAVGLGSIYLLQFTIGFLRQRFGPVSRLVDNEPLLLMVGDRLLHENLRLARVTESDLWAKLREANVLDPAHVRAVVFETTGDVSVLHGEPDGTPLDPRLLRDVREGEVLAERVRGAANGIKRPTSGEAGR